MKEQNKKGSQLVNQASHKQNNQVPMQARKTVIPTQKVNPIKVPRSKFHDFKLGILAINCSNFIVARLFLVLCSNQGIQVDASYLGGVAKAWKEFNSDIAFVYDSTSKKIKCNNVNRYRKETYEIYKIG